VQHNGELVLQQDGEQGSRGPAVHIKNPATGRCLGLGGTYGEGYNVRLYECDDSDAHKWRFDWKKKAIINQRSGRELCLDDASNNVIVWPCHHGSNQKWMWLGCDPGILVNPIKDLCLDVNMNNQNVIITWCHGGTTQRFAPVQGESHPYGMLQFTAARGESHPYERRAMLQVKEVAVRHSGESVLRHEVQEFEDGEELEVSAPFGEPVIDGKCQWVEGTTYSEGGDRLFRVDELSDAAECANYCRSFKSTKEGWTDKQCKYFSFAPQGASNGQKSDAPFEKSRCIGCYTLDNQATHGGFTLYTMQNTGAYQYNNDAAKNDFSNNAQCTGEYLNLKPGSISADDTTFRCLGANCIPSSERCDGIRNCWDNSDEFRCDVAVGPFDNTNKGNCSADYDDLKPGTVSADGEVFSCLGLHCIKGSERCDGIRNCGDNSDELACDRIQNTDAQDLNAYSLTWAVPNRWTYLVGVDSKCSPVPSTGAYPTEETEGRLWREDNVPNRAECFKKCAQNDDCTFYSYQEKNDPSAPEDDRQYDQVCIGCTGDGKISDSGMRTYSRGMRTSFGEPVIDEKCQWVEGTTYSEGGDRLFRVDELSDAAECANYCRSFKSTKEGWTDKQCKYFSFAPQGASNGQKSDAPFEKSRCIGCYTLDNQATHGGFTLYTMGYPSPA